MYRSLYVAIAQGNSNRSTTALFIDYAVMLIQSTIFSENYNEVRKDKTDEIFSSIYRDKNSGAFTNRKKNTHTLLNIVNVKSLYNKLDSDSRICIQKHFLFSFITSSCLVTSYTLRLFDVQSSTVIFVITIKNYDNIRTANSAFILNYLSVFLLFSFLFLVEYKLFKCIIQRTFLP